MSCRIAASAWAAPSNAGLYTFKFGDGSQVHARYTFTCKWNGKDWLITCHHSSAMPETN